MKNLYGKIIGISLMLMTLAVFFAYGYVYNNMVDYSDALATFTNISNDLATFQSSLAGWITILILDIVISIALYLYLKESHKTLAIATGLTRLVYSGILGAAIWQQTYVIQAVKTASETVDVKTANEALNHLQNFESIWALGLIIFGIHLVLAALAARPLNEVPKWILILLLIAGVSYSLTNFLISFVPQANDFTAVLNIVLMLPMTLGELGFGVWLIFNKGAKEKGTANVSPSK